jgi:DNA-binding beta-propeller fold protein YncE
MITGVRYKRRLLGLALLAGAWPMSAWGGQVDSEIRVAPASTVQALPAPQWVGGTSVRGKARVAWIRSGAFAVVRVYRREDVAQAPFIPLGETRENAWIDETVRPGRTYYYRLAGVGPDGRESPPSAELVLRVGVTTVLPATPPDWDGYLVLPDGIGLKWSVREGEDVLVWNIYRKSPPETKFQLVGSSRATSYLDVGLEPDRPYVYVLTALDSEFRETAFSRELQVQFTRAAAAPPKRPAPAWVVRRTRLVSIVGGGVDLPFERPADVAVGPVTGNVYVTDSGSNLVFVFSPRGGFQRTLGAKPDGASIFKNLLGAATDVDENLYVTDAGSGAVQVFSPKGQLSRRIDLSRPAGLGATGLIDAAIGPDGLVHVVDNYNNWVSVVGPDGAPRSFGQAGAKSGEFSAPTFCAFDAAGNLVVADCLNARVQVFRESGEFVLSFGRADRGPGGLGRPKGVAVSAAGEIYVADSWLNRIQVFDAEGQFVAILGDEAGRPLDLGSPNGVALGRGKLIYVAERLAARLQIRELIDVP